MDLRRELVKCDDVTIEALLVGDGGPLAVLLPGASRGADDLVPLAHALEQAGWRAAVLHPRGAGRSDGPDPESLSDLAGDVAGVIQALDGAPAVVIGHAFGNRVARVLATESPALVRALVLLAAGGRVPPLPDAQKAMAGLAERPSPEERRELVRRAYFAQGSDPTPWLSGGWPKAGKAQRRAGRSPAPEQWWAGGTAPMLVVQGSEDGCAPPANGHELALAFPDRVECVDLPNAGHALPIEAPETVASVVIEYLTKLP